MFNIFSDKEKESETKYSKNIEDVQKVEPAVIEPAQVTPTLSKEEKIDKYVKEQCLELGLDIKNDVERASRAFFNSRNEKKANAYKLFEEYLEEFDKNQKGDLQRITYSEFKDKEEQINSKLQNGFAQHLTKGATLDEKNREIVLLVFGDIKKFPSRGHRYWYYRDYIWQKRAD